MKRTAFLHAMAGVCLTASCTNGSCNDARHELSAAEEVLRGSFGFVCRYFGDVAAVASTEPNAVLPSASLAKLLVAVAAAHAISRGELEEVAMLAPTRHAIKQAPGTVLPIDSSRSFPLSSLIETMLAQSDNLAADILIDRLSPNFINGVAHELGLRVTRVHGDFVESNRYIAPQGRTTPAEVASLLQVILEGARSHAANAPTYNLILRSLAHQTDRRMIPSALPSGTAVANKTGEIAGVLADAAIVWPYSPTPLLLTILIDDVPPLYDPVGYAAAIDSIKKIAASSFAVARTCANLH